MCLGGVARLQRDVPGKRRIRELRNHPDTGGDHRNLSLEEEVGVADTGQIGDRGLEIQVRHGIDHELQRFDAGRLIYRDRSIVGDDLAAVLRRRLVKLVVGDRSIHAPDAFVRVCQLLGGGELILPGPVGGGVLDTRRVEHLLVVKD